MKARMPAAGEILAWLAGAWSFEREVSGLATMKGDATFLSEGTDSATYEEKTVVQMLDGQTMYGSQQYLYRQKLDGFAVYFAGGAPRLPGREALFHEVTFVAGEDGSLCGQAQHVCKSDVYESAYRVLPDGTFTICHNVQGPHKEYKIHTVFERKP